MQTELQQCVKRKFLKTVGGWRRIYLSMALYFYIQVLTFKVIVVLTCIQNKNVYMYNYYMNVLSNRYKILANHNHYDGSKNAI
jgi:hypothetical protein